MRPLSERQKRWAEAAFVNGPLRPIASVAFRALLNLEAAAAARLPARDPDCGFSDVTALIKTFERPAQCARLIRSIHRLYPDMNVVVVDDSRQPRPISGTKSVILPFDSGVSAGRQAGLAHITTPFVLNLDDDFLLYGGSRVGAALMTLRDHPEIDLIGGRVIDLPLMIEHDFRNARLHPTAATSVVPTGTRIGDVEILDKVPNFFLARTESVLAVGWDKQLKRLDHADFFTRAKGRIVSGLLRHFRVLHLRDPFNAYYRAHRDRIDDDLALLAAKYPAAGKANHRAAPALAPSTEDPET